MIYSDLVDYIGLNVSEEVWAEHLKKALGRNAERSGYIHELERSKFSNAGCGKKLIEIYRKML